VRIRKAEAFLGPLVLFFFLAHCSPHKEREVKVVRNPEKGLWQREGTHEVVLKKIFTIGEVDSLSLERRKGMGGMAPQEEMGPYEFYWPGDVKVGRNGNIYVLDSGNHRIQVFDRNGRFLRSIGRFGQGPGEFNRPKALALDSENNLYVADTQNGRIQILDERGQYIHSFPCKYGEPMELIVDSKKNIYAYLHGDQVLVRKFDFWGKPLGSFGELLNDREIIGWEFGGNAFSQVCFTLDRDTLYVCYRGIYRVDKYTLDGHLILTFSREFKQVNKILERYKRYNLSGKVAKSMPGLIHDIAFLTEGRLIWVIALTRLDIFSPQGLFLFSLEGGEIRDIAFTQDQGVLALRPRQMNCTKYQYFIQ